MNEHLRTRLRQAFEPDIEWLESATGRELSAWKGTDGVGRERRRAHV